MILSIIENLQREDLNRLRKQKHQSLIDKGYTHAKYFDKNGGNHVHILQSCSIASTLPDFILAEVETGSISAHVSFPNQTTC